MHMGFAERGIQIEDSLLPMGLLCLVVMQGVFVGEFLTTDQSGGHAMAGTMLHSTGLQVASTRL